MKRHPGLREFSDDHHGGLVNARRLRRTASAEDGRSARDAALAFLKLWREETGPTSEKKRRSSCRYSRATGETSRAGPSHACSPNTHGSGAWQWS